jgi:hypothetical protein
MITSGTAGKLHEIIRILNAEGDNDSDFKKYCVVRETKISRQHRVETWYTREIKVFSVVFTLTVDDDDTNMQDTEYLVDGIKFEIVTVDFESLTGLEKPCWKMEAGVGSGRKDLWAPQYITPHDWVWDIPRKLPTTFRDDLDGKVASARERGTEGEYEGIDVGMTEGRREGENGKVEGKTVGEREGLLG